MTGSTYRPPGRRVGFNATESELAAIEKLKPIVGAESISALLRALVRRAEDAVSDEPLMSKKVLDRDDVLALLSRSAIDGSVIAQGALLKELPATPQQPAVIGVVHQLADRRAKADPS